MRNVPALVGLGLAAVGCFGPKLGDQPFACGTGGACPDGYHCSGGVCLAAGSELDAAPPCTANAFLRCDGPTVAVFCNAQGNGEAPQTCGFQCDATAQRCDACDPGRGSQCVGNLLATCNAQGQITSSSPCAGFCDPNGGPHCAVLEPSNLSKQICDNAGTISLQVTSLSAIDTTACQGGSVVDQGSGAGCAVPPKLCLLKYQNLTVQSGARLVVMGQNGLALVVTDTATIDGTIDVSAAGAAGGPGAGDSCAGMTGLGLLTNGGWGAGFGTDGATGGFDVGGSGGTPGVEYGGFDLQPLYAGSTGGASGTGATCPTTCPNPSAGGGGGGALQLVACSSLVLSTTARIDAGGGGGSGGVGATNTAALAGGGGGSGGGILIEAPLIVIPGGGAAGDGAILAANGGGGGGGGEHGGGHASGGPGDDGPLGATPARGGVPGASTAGAGGTGGTQATPSSSGSLPAPGNNPNTPQNGAGGGGGAAGRIHLSSRSDAAPVIQPGAIVSPAPTTGTITGHPQ
jgi:hypothetical protein